MYTDRDRFAPQPDLLHRRQSASKGDNPKNSTFQSQKESRTERRNRYSYSALSDVILHRTIACFAVANLFARWSSCNVDLTARKRQTLHLKDEIQVQTCADIEVTKAADL